MLSVYRAISCFNKHFFLYVPLFWSRPLLHRPTSWFTVYKSLVTLNTISVYPFGVFLIPSVYIYFCLCRYGWSLRLSYFSDMWNSETGNLSFARLVPRSGVFPISFLVGFFLVTTPLARDLWRRRLPLAVSLTPFLVPVFASPPGSGCSSLSVFSVQFWTFSFLPRSFRLRVLPFVRFLHLGYFRTSGLRGVGTRAPRVLPPPTGTFRLSETRHLLTTDWRKCRL